MWLLLVVSSSSSLLFLLGRTPLYRVTAPVSSAAARRVTTLGRWTLLLRIAAPVLAVAGTGVGEGRAVLGDGLSPLGVDAPPDKGVDALADKGSCTSPSKYSAGATRVERLLLALSSDVTTTDDEVMRAFSTGSSSFALPNVSLATGRPKEIAFSARGVNGQRRVIHPSVAAVETGPNGRAPFFFSTRALAGLVADWGSTRGVNGQGRVLHSSAAAVETRPNGRPPFSSSTRVLGGLVAG